ncbi:hypothetical protein M3P19_02345 [Muricauda sp. 2012CJ35-5]|uniref:DUF4386 domain-containing protein n=1 Tax=Flagellimonas spongiicola TaxID=2942208 RepID=A0ABT0PQ57_9FLAO|nr:hypothetical protein [Allomuricauda spongiicola]MCL6272827.1 hypothetical protein [Allomuricauda spongiicola]
MNKTATFLRFTAICSFLGALTTALLIFLPHPSAVDFETSVLLYENKLYLSRLWILFMHPQFNFIAAIGIAYLFIRKYPLCISIGTLFLFVWAYTEISQQALLIDSLNQIWRPGYVNAENEIAKDMYSTLIHAANGISDSKYFLVIYGFGLGTLLFGLAFVQERNWPRWLGFAMLFIGILSLSSFLRYYLNVSALNGIVNWCYEWIYGYLQPLVRIGLGIWILHQIKHSNPNLNTSKK